MDHQVAILGANSLLGQHLLNALSSQRRHRVKCIRVWNLGERFSHRIAANNNSPFVKMEMFEGMDSLDAALQDCDIVFNLHEVQDFSVIPNKKTLEEQNVEFVRHLMNVCRMPATSTDSLQVQRRLIHLSTIYLQCSSRWPNVYGREAEDYSLYKNQVPFPAYCGSKHRAEEMMRLAGESVQSVSARVGPLYGEGDRCSLICDSILVSRHRPQIPRIGDQNGVLQFTYAGNAAHALLKCAEKLLLDPSIRNEVVNIQDDTPVRNFYDLTLRPLYEDECEDSVDASGPERDDSTATKKDEEDKTECAFVKKISEKRVSFYLFFPLYFLMAALGRLLGNVLGVETRLAKFPSPDYLYLVFHHWTFFSDFKLRIFFEYQPKFDYATSLKRSLHYYRQLKPDQITKFSWRPCGGEGREEGHKLRTFS